jgi:hypothetical protein
MNALLLLLAVTSTIVLRSGERITVEGQPNEANGVITFRSSGALYSLPAEEVERIDRETPSADGSKDETAKPKPRGRRLQVSDEERKRLLEALQNNHYGVPSPPPAPVSDVMTPRSREEVAQEKAEQKREESYWRASARAHQESVRRAQEDLALLETRIEELRSQIHSFVSLGYKPNQFTYQSTQLHLSIERIPSARLAVTRAERAYEQFREDARRDGVMPGWLR